MRGPATTVVTFRRDACQEAVEPVGYSACRAARRRGNTTKQREAHLWYAADSEKARLVISGIARLLVRASWYYAIAQAGVLLATTRRVVGSIRTKRKGQVVAMPGVVGPSERKVEHRITQNAVSYAGATSAIATAVVS